MNPLARLDSLLQRKPWLTRGMLVVCSFSLLATSEDYVPPPPSTRHSEAPRCTLTAESPACEVLVTLTHEAADVVVTELASATIHGTIAAEGVTGDRPFVAVHVASEDQPGANDLSVLTEFSLVRPLEFSGNCDASTTGAPCVSAFSVSFQRSDLGERGGTIHVDWQLDLEASPPSGSDTSPATLPWTVEYEGP